MENDTHPAIARILIEHRRRMTPTEKLRQLCELNAFAFQAAQADIRRRFPRESEEEQLRRVLLRYYPADILDKALAARRKRGFG